MLRIFTRVTHTSKITEATEETIEVAEETTEVAEEVEEAEDHTKVITLATQACNLKIEVSSILALLTQL